MKKEINHPLVSCTVLSYNSAGTIEETLDSVKNQTYSNLELIISDDCSTDSTVEIAEKWLENNEGRFVRVVLLTTSNNTGVCENCNRALNACQGVWQKGIAADDILLPNCISDFVSFVNDNKDARWVSSYIRVYDEVFEDGHCLNELAVSRLSFFELNAEEQLKDITQRNVINACSLFYEIKMIRELGGYDASFSFEDYPFYVKTLENGYKCFFMPKETVGYRVHTSISHSSGQLFNYKFCVESRLFKKNKCFKYFNKKQCLGHYFLWGLQDVVEKLNLNRNKAFWGKLYVKMENLIYRVFIYN